MLAGLQPSTIPERHGYQQMGQEYEKPYKNLQRHVDGDGLELRKISGIAKPLACWRALPLI